MVNPPVLEATFASGIILIATGFYGTQFLINHSGSDTAKLAIETNFECLSMVDLSDNYANCTYRLEKLMKNLTDSGEIQTEECELDETDDNIAYCPVWAWYYPQWLPMTDVTIVGVVGTKTDSETIQPSSKLEKIFSKLSDASRQLDSTDMSEKGKMERLRKLGKIFSSKSGAPAQFPDDSELANKDLYSDELDDIFSAILVASQDITDELEEGKPDYSDDDDIENNLSVLSLAAAALQTPDGKNMIQKTLLTLSGHLSMNNFDMLLRNPELLQIFINNFDAKDIENILKNSNLIESFSKTLQTNDLADPMLGPLGSLLPVLLSSFGTNDANTLDKLGQISKLLQGLESEGVDDFLQKSGLIELIMQHLETHYLDEVSDKSDIERALAQNLKSNHYFENTLKSGITDIISEGLQKYNSQGASGKVDLLKLLAPILEADGIAGSIEKLNVFKEFLQNPKIDIIDLLERSGLLGTLLPHLEANYIESFHDKSDLGQALVDNLKTNHYIHDSERPDLIKRFEPNLETDKKGSNGNSGLISQKKDKKNIQSLGMGFLKEFIPDSETNMVQNSFNNKKMDVMNALLQNIKIEDVVNFLQKSGLIEALVQPHDTNHLGKSRDKLDLEQEIKLNDKTNDYGGNPISADIKKSFLPNTETKNTEDFTVISKYSDTKNSQNPLNSVDTLNLSAPSLEDNVSQFETPLNKLAIMKKLFENIDIKDVMHVLGKSVLTEALTQGLEKFPKEPFKNKLDLGQALLQTLESNNKEDYLPGKLGFIQALIDNISSQNAVGNSFNEESTVYGSHNSDNQLGDTLGFGQTVDENMHKTKEEAFDNVDLLSLLSKIQQPSQDNQLNTIESVKDFEDKEDTSAYQEYERNNEEQDDKYSKVSGHRNRKSRLRNQE